MNWDYFMVWFAARAKAGKKGVRHHPMDECLNCEEKLEKEQYFCPHCGQKVHNSKLTVWSLIGEFFAGIFNLDNGVYRSLINLPRPGYLSKKFMSGRRKRYLNPIRLFLVTLIIHIAVLSNIAPIEEVNRASAHYLEQIGQKKLQTKYYAIKDTSALSLDNCELDSLESLVFSTVSIANDTLHLFSRKEGQSSVINDDGNPIGRLLERDYKFHRGDMYDMSVDEFLQTYKAETYWERIGMTQLIRTMRDPAGAIRFGMGNLIWSVLSTIIILGLFMKLLYIRNNRYYVEHLIVLFNVHSFAFLLASLGFYIGFTVHGPENVIDDYAFLIIMLFFFLSIKFYYQQGWIKSFIKFVMIGFLYLFMLIVMVLLVTIVSLFFFK